jgi:hypothetical protein
MKNDRVVTATLLIGAAVMLGAGIACLFWPESFADWVEFPPSEHFVHDAGAFQVAIGLGLLGAVWWRDAQAVYRWRIYATHRRNSQALVIPHFSPAAAYRPGTHSVRSRRSHP